MSGCDQLSSTTPVSTGVTPYGPFEIRWTETGPANAPPLLLLHGIYAGAHSYEWRELVPELSSTFRVRAPDILGTGRSDRPAFTFEPDLLTSIVRTIIEDAGDDVHVVASSLTGAYAVRTIAAGTPVRALTLITPSGLGKKREAARAERGHRLYHTAAERAAPGRGSATGGGTDPLAERRTQAAGVVSPDGSRLLA